MTKGFEGGSVKKEPTKLEKIQARIAEEAQKQIAAEMQRREEAGEFTQLDSGVRVTMTKEEKKAISAKVTSEFSQKALSNIADENKVPRYKKVQGSGEARVGGEVKSTNLKQLEQWEVENPDKITAYKAGAKEQKHAEQIDELKKDIDAHGGGATGAADLLNDKFGK